ncbi:MAG: hypothetical protein OQK24_11505 [Magnetovibrio sp.]|nr:hypothetical protein [Magnetovibrio sp.]
MTKHINLIDPHRASEVARRVAADLLAAPAQQFFGRNVARWLRKRVDCMVRSRPLLGDANWVHLAHKNGQPVHRFQISDETAEQLEHLHAWVKFAVGEVNKPGHPGAEARRALNGLPSMNVDDALRKAQTWHRNELLRLTDAPPRGEHGYVTNPLCTIEVADGYVWEKLSASDLPFVGYDLLNCLRNGAYVREVATRIVALWALRRPDNGRFVVVLTTPGQSHEVIGVRGFRNARPLAYKTQIQELMDELGSPPSSGHDLKAINL